MSRKNAPEPHKPHPPRTGTTAPFVVDRQTVDALPTPIHKAIAEKLIAEGAWVVKDAENKGGAE